MKSDFDKNLAILKGLEERAKKTRNEMDKFMAERMRDNMMSYRGMTSQVLLAACSKSPEVRRHVLDLMKRREVEEMHRLWVKYCKKK